MWDSSESSQIENMARGLLINRVERFLNLYLMESISSDEQTHTVC